MHRTIAVLFGMLLLSAASADKFGSFRDRNLREITEGCIVVFVSDNFPNADVLKSDIEQALNDRAFLYGIPVGSPCFGKPEFNIAFTTIESRLAISVDFNVLVNRVGNYTLPSVWNVGSYGYTPIGFGADDILDIGLQLFEDFALAWRRQHE